MIYFDAAATTFQKPPQVARAVYRAMQTLSSPGRGSYASSEAAEELSFRCRGLAAEIFHVPSREQVVFTMNATHACNIAVKTLVREGDHVVISGYEHNAVTRPLHALGASVSVAASPLFDRRAALHAFENTLRGNTKAVICTHVSNVFGYILPIGEIAALCRRADIPLIVDASQSAGVLPLDFASLGAAFAAMPGHKGLYGPQGTGLLLCGAEAKPLMEGGTGSESLRQTMPEFLPDRLEAGTHNMPGIAGLYEGLRFVSARGIGEIAARERHLTEYAKKKLAGIGRVRLFAADDSDAQTAVMSLTLRDADATEAAEALGRQGIAVRGGLHCAPLAHKSAGTLPLGTLRLSFSYFNRSAEIDTLSAALRGKLSV